MTAGHAHHLDHRSVQRRALWIALGMNLAYVVVEIVGGFAFNSLALLADAAHMMSDVVGLAIALAAQGLMTRPASARHTYGFQRAEVLGALANGLTLLVVVGWIVFEAIRRYADPEPIDGGGVLMVAAVGLLINVVSAVVIKRAQGKSLNMRGAYVHMASDAAGSVAVIVAGAAVLLWDAHWVDPLASITIALLILWATWGLLRDTVHVLMEGAPPGLDPGTVEEAINARPGVDSVHHLHLWNLASDTPALSAHIVVPDDDLSLHDAQDRGDDLRHMLSERFGISHVTLEMECHPCGEVAVESGARLLNQDNGIRP